ncbi:MAG: outer membrane beta-barrel protein, partial [Nitrospinota bacterium]
SGRATVGATVRDFDLAGRDTEVDFSVGTELTWRPLARTFLNLIILREFADTSTPGQFGLVRSTFQVTGNQAFTKYLAAHVLLRAVTDDFVSSARDDITYNVIVGGTYHLLRWLGVGLRYERESKDSDVSVNDYDQNQVILTLTVGLRSFLPAFP